MSLKSILGHQTQIKILQTGLQQQTLAHAYLFHGPSGIGKETIARFLSKALNCEQENGDCCQTCSPCQRIEQGTFADSYLITPSGAARKIKMEDILNLQKKLILSRYEGRARTIIISDADRLNDASGNALLKVLEEPLQKTYFFLISSNQEALLSTIRSRCRQMAFHSLSEENIKQLLTEQNIETNNKLDLLAKLSEGRLDKAIQLNEETSRKVRQQLLKFVLSQKNSASEALLLSTEMAKIVEEDKKYLLEILETLEIIYRDLLASQQQVKDLNIINIDWKQGIDQKSNQIKPEKIENYISCIERIRSDLHLNLQVKFAFDYLFLYLAGQQAN